LGYILKTKKEEEKREKAKEGKNTLNRLFAGILTTLPFSLTSS
jgi:hypothetical protein